jgi:hypothetical protein
MFITIRHNVQVCLWYISTRNCTFHQSLTFVFYHLSACLEASESQWGWNQSKSWIYFWAHCTDLHRVCLEEETKWSQGADECCVTHSRFPCFALEREATNFLPSPDPLLTSETLIFPRLSLPSCVSCWRPFRARAHFVSRKVRDNCHKIRLETYVSVAEGRLYWTIICYHAFFLLSLFFEPEDGGDKFLRNVRRHSKEFTSYPTSRTCSQQPLWEPQISNFYCQYLVFFLLKLYGGGGGDGAWLVPLTRCYILYPSVCRPLPATIRCYRIDISPWSLRSAILYHAPALLAPPVDEAGIPLKSEAEAVCRQQVPRDSRPVFFST